MKIRILVLMVVVLAVLAVLSWRNGPSVVEAGRDASTRPAQVSPSPVDSSGLPVLARVPDFRLVDEDGRPVTRADLAGHPFVLNFAYTTCGTYCPMVMQQVTVLRRYLDPLPGVRTVTVSVDPEHDQPAQLKKYEQRYGGHDERYLYLTGEKRQIVSLLQGVHLLPPGPIRELDREMHSTRLILVDAESRVRGYFPYDSPEERRKLVIAAGALEGAAVALGRP